MYLDNASIGGTSDNMILEKILVVYLSGMRAGSIVRNYQLPTLG